MEMPERTPQNGLRATEMENAWPDLRRCDCPECRPAPHYEDIDDLNLQDYQVKKGRNQKWETNAREKAKRTRRLNLRAPVDGRAFDLERGRKLPVLFSKPKSRKHETSFLKQDLRDLHDFQGHVRTTYRSDPTAPPEEDDIWVEIKYKIVSTPCEESGFDDHYEACKGRNRKYDTARRNHRRYRRTPVAFRAMRASYSARSARKLPTACRRHHVEQALHRKLRKNWKFLLMKQELQELY